MSDWKPGQRKEVDPEKVRMLASIACTAAEIGAVLGVSRDTIERNYREVLNEGIDKCRASIRRKLYALAMQGNLGALIWLSKQYLGFRDQVDMRQQSVSVTLPPDYVLAVKRALGYDPECLAATTVSIQTNGHLPTSEYLPD